MKEVCPELKTHEAITMKEIDNVINLLTVNIVIEVRPQEPGINPRATFTLDFTLNIFFMLIATVCYRTSASRSEIENKLYNSRNDNDPIIIVKGGCTKTVNDLITKIASLNLIRNTAISDYQQEAKWTLTPLGERIYKEIELRRFTLKIQSTIKKDKLQSPKATDHAKFAANYTKHLELIQDK